MSIEHAHPAWLAARWLHRYGLEAAQARLAANNRIPPLTIRVNTLKTDPDSLRNRLAGEGIQARPCALSPVGLQLGDMEVPPLSVKSYWEGLWLFQDEAAQLVTYLLDPRPGETVLELGAGRGGKTTHLAELMTARGVIQAVDNHKGRLQDLRINLRRWGVHMVQPLLADATQPLHLRVRDFDGAVVDAPCSALGILRRHPEIKTRLTEDDLDTFPPRQRAMLAAAAPLLKPGGRLLYITCTTEPEDNQKVVEGFLREHPNFHLSTDPGLLPPPARSLVHPPGYFITSPEQLGLDGFFAATLTKQ
jgi:16S rRNA (cytosine967-C5)-methyltransferase